MSKSSSTSGTSSSEDTPTWGKKPLFVIPKLANLNTSPEIEEEVLEELEGAEDYGEEEINEDGEDIIEEEEDFEEEPADVDEEEEGENSDGKTEEEGAEEVEISTEEPNDQDESDEEYEKFEEDK
eukprot:12761252-Ditylum_brightwellii.AAC.1